MRSLKLFGALLVIAIASPASAQIITGRVVDSVRKTPIKQAAITLMDGFSVVANMRTADSGTFSVRGRRAGAYTLTVKRVGYAPISIRIDLADGQTTNRVIMMTELSTALDTMVIEAKRAGFFAKTPGRVTYQQHMQSNIGQMVSGVEIAASKMGVMDFLGSMPGFRVVRTVRVPVPGAHATNSPPTIPGRGGYLLSSGGEQCLYGRIDRYSIPGLLDLYDVDAIEDLVEVDEIMGIEMYTNQLEVPPEWRNGVLDLVWRTARNGQSYFIGDPGFPTRLRPTMREVATDPTDNRPAPEWFWARHPAPPAVMLDSATMAQLPLTTVWTRLTRVWTALKDLEIKSVSLPSINPPQCGFVQIWTKRAW
jgi:hypothetical protein